jgi:hypothetical protein
MMLILPAAGAPLCVAQPARPGPGSPMRPIRRPGPRVDWGQIEKNLLAFAKEHYPPFLAARLEKLKQGDRPQYHRALMRLGMQYRKVEQYRKRNGQLAEALLAEYRLRMTAEHVAEQYRAAAEDQRDALLKSLRQEAAKAFDASQKRRKLELADLQKRLDLLNKSLEQRKASRDVLVARFVERLLAGRTTTRPSPGPVTRPFERRPMPFIRRRQPQRPGPAEGGATARPGQFWGTGRGDMGRMPRPARTWRTDPELVKIIGRQSQLMRRARELARIHRRANDESKRAQTKAQLDDVAGKYFDVAGERIGLEARRLTQQLGRIRSDIERRGQLREQIIEKYISRLLYVDTPEL